MFVLGDLRRLPAPYGVYGERLFVEALTMSVILAYVRLRHGTLRGLVGGRSFRVTDPLVGAVVGTATFAVVSLVSVWATRELLGFTPRGGGGFPSMSGAIAAQLSSFVILGPLNEELAFRSYAYQGARKHMGRVLAAVLSAAVFALIHAPGLLVGVVSAERELLATMGLGIVFAYGLVFATVFQRRNLWAAWSAHATVNGLHAAVWF